jgi:radical SAM protein with 4Fe4S-binding SPASM domain
MSMFLTRYAAIKWLESPSVYHIAKDELYELDDESFVFMKQCMSPGGCITVDSEFFRFCAEEGLLDMRNDPVKRPLVAQSPIPSLRYLELQITDRCNLKCRHCYIKKQDYHELSPEKTLGILHEFEEMQGLRLLITGGEPLMHPDFMAINEMLPEFLLRKVLFSNGVLLDKGILKHLNVNEIQISIDGLEAAHDSLRGKGAFCSAMKAVRLAMDAGIEVSIATMVHPANLNDFDEMGSLFTGLGVREWSVDIPCITGRLHDNSAFQISPEKGGRYLGYGFGGGMHGSSPGFACGLHLMAVMADGKVAKCTFFTDESAGRIEDGLKECWRRIQPVSLGVLDCDCEYLESCRGGCRYRAKLMGGPFGKDFYRCALYGILKNETGA